MAPDTGEKEKEQPLVLELSDLFPGLKEFPPTMTGAQRFAYIVNELAYSGKISDLQFAHSKETDYQPSHSCELVRGSRPRLDFYINIIFNTENHPRQIPSHQFNGVVYPDGGIEAPRELGGYNYWRNILYLPQTGAFLRYMPIIEKLQKKA